MSLRAVLSSCAATLACLAACTSPEATADIAARRVDPIYRGTPAPNDPAVVALTMQGQGAFCTGTLITPTIVLTAAHCLQELSGYLDYTRVFFGADAEGSGVTRNVRRIAQHPTYSDRALTGDIGLVELTTAAPAEVTPIPYLPASKGLSSADHGGSIRFVGFGYTETGAYGQRRQVNGQIGKVCTSGQCTYMGDYLNAGTFAYAQSNGGPCSGDSGGPAFISRDGQPYVVGVTSYGDQECAIMGVSTSVDYYEAFILDFMAGGGGVVDEPVTPSDCNSASCAPGAACDADDDCGNGGVCFTEDDYPEFGGGYCSSACRSDNDCAGDGVCVDAGGDTLCLDACNRNSDCRSGYECDTSAGTGLCLPSEGGGGPSPIGGACNVSSDCNQQGSFCASAVNGFPLGLCTADCSRDADCTSGSVCSDGLCAKPCQRSSECRAGYACWPDADHAGGGVCWAACASNSDCEGGETCNPQGLCGTAAPPQPEAGDEDGDATPRKKDSCAATSPTWLAGLAVTLMLRRRRR